MKHFDTLTAYNNLIAAGVAPDVATAEVRNISHFASDIFEILVSQRVVLLIGATLVAIGAFLCVTTWDLSIDMRHVVHRLDNIEARLGVVENSLANVKTKL